MGVDDGVIVVCIDSFGVGLIQKVLVSQQFGDLVSEYIKWLKIEQIIEENFICEGELVIYQGGEFVKFVCLLNGLFFFCEGIGCQCVIEDCIVSLNDGGVDLLWIEIDILNVDEIVSMVVEICKQVFKVKLIYNNLFSFNWMLNLCKQVCM